MERRAPSLWQLIFLAVIIAVFLLSWVALLVGSTLQIGPFAGIVINASPEVRGLIVRWSAYVVIIGVVSFLLLRLITRKIVRNVPENFAAVIEANNGNRIVTVARRVWVMPIAESFSTMDLHPRDLHFTHQATTHDKLVITLHVKLTWQPYVEDLQMVLDAKIQQDSVLQGLAERQLTQDINKRNLDEVQANLKQIAFHLMRHVAYPEPQLEGARKYGISLQEAMITKLDLPPEIVELNKTHKLTELRKKYGPTQPGMSAG